MPLYKLVTSSDELEQVLALQLANLKQNISQSEKEKEGFVTLQHSKEVLDMMHAIQPSVIAIDAGKVIGYALVMHPACRPLVPDLDPLFSLVDTLAYKGRPFQQFHYYVMGQICIDKRYRGSGVFAGLYQAHKEHFSQQYDFVVTEISVNNKRSLRAHEKTGFRVIHQHTDLTDDWVVVLWDWTS